eukprot:8086359-Lingulodinium_polyedra.AAC.1
MRRPRSKTRTPDGSSKSTSRAHCIRSRAGASTCTRMQPPLSRRSWKRRGRPSRSPRGPSGSSGSPPAPGRGCSTARQCWPRPTRPGPEPAAPRAPSARRQRLRRAGSTATGRRSAAVSGR